MGRYDSELRSYPSACGNVFQLHPCRLTPPFMILIGISFLYMPPSEIHVFKLRSQQYGREARRVSAKMALFDSLEP